MTVKNSLTAKHKREVERIWRRHCAREGSSTTANYDTFTFRPGNQAADIRNPFKQMSSDSLAIPVPTIAPRDSYRSGLILSRPGIKNANLNEDGRDENYPSHANPHSFAAAPLNGGGDMQMRETSWGPKEAHPPEMGNHGLGQDEHGEGSDYALEECKEKKSPGGPKGWGGGMKRPELDRPVNAENKAENAKDEEIVVGNNKESKADSEETKDTEAEVGNKPSESTEAGIEDKSGWENFGDLMDLSA